MSCKLEPAIWSRGTCQRIACFDRCQLIIAGMSNFNEVHGKLSLYVSFLEYGAMLDNSAVVVVVVVRTRPREIPLVKITMRKSTHGFLLSFPCMMSMGLRLALGAGAPNTLRRQCSIKIKDLRNRLTWNKVEKVTFSQDQENMTHPRTNKNDHFSFCH